MNRKDKKKKKDIRIENGLERNIYGFVKSLQQYTSHSIGYLMSGKSEAFWALNLEMMMDEWGNEYDEKMVSWKNNMNFISSGLRKKKERVGDMV